MRKCPVCDLELSAVEYEGYIVRRCASCNGHLMRLNKMKSIERVDHKTQEQLKSEASAEFSKNCTQRLRCPRCHLPMHKQAINLPVIDLQYDICTGCSLAWLDGGELALVQLAYQASSGFLNAQELKRRVRELEASPEGKAIFKANMAKLSETRHPVEEVLGEAAEAFDGVLRALIVAPF